MNYYPFHLGDYNSHTAHLAPLEDLAYRRMLDAYYLRECPLPVDVGEIARLIRMRKNSVEIDAILREFFELSADGWRHTRCELEIDRMRDKQAKARLSAAASVKSRQAKAEFVQGKGATSAERTLSERSTDVELPTPTPTPTPTPRTPPDVAEDQNQSAHTARAPKCPTAASVDGDFLGPLAGSVLPAGRTLGSAVTWALSRAGLQRTNPSHPKLLALLEAGATVEEFLAAWADVKGKATSNPFTYLLGAVEGRRKEAAALAGQIHQGPMPVATVRETFRERDRRLAAEEAAKWSPRIAAIPGQPIEGHSNIFDLESPHAPAIAGR